MLLPNCQAIAWLGQVKYKRKRIYPQNQRFIIKGKIQLQGPGLKVFPLM